jgi:hypothetical protein
MKELIVEVVSALGVLGGFIYIITQIGKLFKSVWKGLTQKE